MYAIGRPAYFFVGSALLVLALWLFGKGVEAILFAVSFVVTFGIVGALKIILRTPRPKKSMIKTYGYSFPSGHAAAGAFLTVMAYYLAQSLYNETTALVAGGFMIIVTALVAVSRVFLGAHTAVQVLTGLIIGFIAPLAVLLNQTIPL